MASHDIMAGKFHVYLRDTSPVWQCATPLTCSPIKSTQMVMRSKVIDSGETVDRNFSFLSKRQPIHVLREFL